MESVHLPYLRQSPIHANHSALTSELQTFARLDSRTHTDRYLRCRCARALSRLECLERGFPNTKIPGCTSALSVSRYSKDAHKVCRADGWKTTKKQRHAKSYCPGRSLCCSVGRSRSVGIGRHNNLEKHM